MCCRMICEKIGAIEGNFFYRHIVYVLMSPLLMSCGDMMVREKFFFQDIFTKAFMHTAEVRGRGERM